VFLTNTGLSQVGDNYAPQLYTWDIAPMGEVGDSSFRTIDVSGKCTNGYNVQITPYIDGVPLTTQSFTGSGTGEFSCQAFIAARGARIAALITLPTRSGDIEVHNVACSFVPIRRIP